MREFIAGQIVRYKFSLWKQMGGSLNNEEFYRSQYQLKLKDILRGYYFSLGKKVKLSDVETLNELHYNRNLLSGDLQGKFMQPITKVKYTYNVLFGFKAEIYIMWKGKKTLVSGYLMDNMFYFIGMSGIPYKVKTFVDMECYVRGLFTTPLSLKQKSNSFNAMGDIL